ncbi:MAG: hypothetical protein DRP42_02665 [Tenericutes bacterium]|nr:MAG: hypothetical protein DRP42_02665 [Mycoplasmatota bacterium]
MIKYLKPYLGDIFILGLVAFVYIQQGVLPSYAWFALGFSVASISHKIGVIHLNFNIPEWLFINRLVKRSRQMTWNKWIHPMPVAVLFLPLMWGMYFFMESDYTTLVAVMFFTILFLGKWILNVRRDQWRGEIDTKWKRRNGLKKLWFAKEISDDEYFQLWDETKTDEDKEYLAKRRLERAG